jgi:hypothetical protein
MPVPTGFFEILPRFWNPHAIQLGQPAMEWAKLFGMPENAKNSFFAFDMRFSWISDFPVNQYPRNKAKPSCIAGAFFAHDPAGFPGFQEEPKVRRTGPKTEWRRP